MTANMKTVERPAEHQSPPDAGWRLAPSPEVEAHAIDDAGDEPLDYWEEVALSRLRLAQWALAATLVASVVIALILG